MDIAAAEAIPTNWDKIIDPVMENNARYTMDSRLYVQFYMRAVMQRGKSEEAGRPIYADVPHVRILVPGDKLSIVDRVASEDDMARFAEHWGKFKAGQGQEVVGTRLEVIPWMSRSKAEEYKYFGIHTVEQLADASDSVGQKFPGFYQDRDRAKQFLEATTGTSAKVKNLEEQVAELTAKLAALSLPQVKIVETPPAPPVTAQAKPVAAKPKE